MAHDIERRRVLQGLGAAALCLSTRPSRAAPKPEPKRLPVVARARRTDVIDARGRIDRAKLGAMTRAAITRATGDATLARAFQRRFGPSDVVGLKLSTLAGKGLSPHPELVAEIVALLKSAGVKEHNIVIWDRTDRELVQAGFTIQRRRSGVRCVGTNDDYDWMPREWGAGGSCFARLLTQELTALINVGVVKDHDLAGISAGMKNWYAKGVKT